ncbi:hypothetical protein ACFL7E_02540 [Thermodesulfobacteriota bacterium]
MKSNKNNKLTAKQKSAIPHIVASATLEEGRKRARIARSTLYEWLKIPAFQEELKRQRHTVSNQALEGIRGYITKSADTLFEIMVTTKNEKIKRDVANDLLGYGFKLKEYDEIIARLDLIEKRLLG